MPLAVCAAADERRVQSHRDRRRYCFRPGRSAPTKSLADLQGTPAQGRIMLSGVEREHPLQQISRGLVGHHGAEICLQPVQFRRRSAVRWPGDASLDPATCGTAKPGKPQRALAEQRRHRGPGSPSRGKRRHSAGILAAERRASRPARRRSPVEHAPATLRFGQGQSQIGDVSEVIGPVDLHDVRARPLALNPDFPQSQRPGTHPHQVREQTQKYTAGRRTPNRAAVLKHPCLAAPHSAAPCRPSCDACGTRPVADRMSRTGTAL